MEGPFWALEGRGNCHRGSTNLCLRFVAAQGFKGARELAHVILAEGDETIPACVRVALRR
jgi:hypothetical protein